MKVSIKFILLLAATVLLFGINIIFGAVELPMDEILNVLQGGNRDTIAGYIIIENRMPQAFAATLGGAALAVTGLLLQTTFRNPLAGPSILGISSGASLGVAIVMLMLCGSIAIGSSAIGGYAAVITGAIIGSLTITFILTAISMRVANSLMLLIVGIMTGYLTSSVVTLLSSLTTAQGLQGYVMWGMGSFSGMSLSQLPWFATLTSICLILSLMLAKPLNIMLLGDNYARNLGVNISKVKTQILLLTGIMTAIVTAFCGPVAFIGLAVPHIAALLFKTDNHRIILPATAVAGAIVALGCNILSVLPGDRVLPINALTPIVGVPVILYVIISRQYRN